MPQRCVWAESSDLYRDYHDREWGVPVHDDRTLFEFLILEGAQAGLSWKIILDRREHYRSAFSDFDAEKIARYDKNKVEDLLLNSGIVRNRAKIEATILNARLFLETQEKYDNFNSFIWQFVWGKPIQNAWCNMNLVPASTLESDAMSKVLKKLGFKFVGTIICYAFMQAVGMVNDHTVDCFRWKELSGSRK